MESFSELRIHEGRIMDKKIQFFRCDKRSVENDNVKIRDVFFTMSIHESLLKKMFEETQLVNSLEHRRFDDSSLRFQKELWMLDCEHLLNIEQWMRNLWTETCGKYYEYKGCFENVDSAEAYMLGFFESYTGLKREECTEDFRSTLGEFLNDDSGCVKSVFDEIHRLGDDGIDYYVFMRVLDS